MKHFIIAAIVTLGLIAQPAVVSIEQQGSNGQTSAANNWSDQGTSQQLSAEEMGAIAGGDASGCWKYVDENNDEHAICCIDLWIFTVCIGVNVSEIERLLPF